MEAQTKALTLFSKEEASAFLPNQLPLFQSESESEVAKVLCAYTFNRSRGYRAFSALGGWQQQQQQCGRRMEGGVIS